MEHIAGVPGAGPTLRDHLDQKERLPEALACEYAIGICQAMEYANQSKRLVHCDLKPANVFVASSGTVKVGDFGLAVTEGTVIHTQSGTPPYMAPEQFEVDIALTRQLDIYAIGVILFELLSGRRPFILAERLGHAIEQFRYAEYERMHREEQVPSLVTISPETRPDVASIVVRCLEKDPSDRFESFSELRDALAPFASTAFDEAIQTTTNRDYSNSAQSYDRGVSLDSLGHLAEALECYREAITREPFKSQRSEAWCNMGKVLGTMDRTKEALEAFECAVSIDSKDVHAHFGRGNSLTQMGRNTEALSALDTVEELDQKYLDGYVCRGGVFYAMGEMQKAQKAFQKANELEPEYAYALNGLGLCAEAVGHRGEAMAFFERAVASDPNCEPAQQNLGRLRRVPNEDASAHQAGQVGTSDDAEDAISLLNLGITYGNDGRFEEAREYLSRAVSLDPQNSYAFLGLARACGALSRFDEAVKYGLRAAELGQLEGTHIAQTARSMKGQ